ncbi:hypothetical protein KNE206_44750 [Kitasatospora sp. NE20-6]|uniref:class I SAM-dependent methyltransferase n=1 Tax=Kitasatospora sp. NE20-6 TaxID=2859066 RepID=UPI0034DBFDC2
MTAGQPSGHIRYGVSAEFYDLLQAEDDRRAAERRFTAAARAARTGVLDAGAGTGIVTETLVKAAAAPVHAVEPSPAMRIALLARLARLGADERARVTLYPETVGACGLREAVDLAVASNLVATLPPAERRATWRALAAALVPGGLLLFDPPPVGVPDGEESRELPPARLGTDVYAARLTRTPDRGTVAVRYDYRVERGGVVVREEHETFRLWPVEPAVLAEELAEAGLRPADTPHPDLTAARRPPHG